jgi:F-type H+-transporting ATPase subunit alpha
MPVEEQVVSIFAGTTGFLDDLAVEDVKRFETELLADIRARTPQILDGLRGGGALPEEDLTKAITDFKGRFTPSVQAAAAE